MEAVEHHNAVVQRQLCLAVREVRVEGNNLLVVGHHNRWSRSGGVIPGTGFPEDGEPLRPILYLILEFDSGPIRSVAPY